MLNDLKCCPYCAGQARFLQRSVGIKGTNGYDWWHAVQCAHCNAAVGYDDNRYREKADAFKAWNTRSTEPVSVSLEKCAKAHCSARYYGHKSVIPEPADFEYTKSVLDAAGVKYVD